MSYEIAGIGQVSIEASDAGYFDKENASPSRVPVSVHGEIPDYILQIVESPEFRDGLYRGRPFPIRTDGDFPLSHFIRPKGSGSALKSGIFLGALQGYGHDAASKSSVMSATITTTGCDVVTGTFASSDIGCLVAIPCTDGRAYVRELRTISTGATDTITWAPAVPSTPSGTLNGCKTYYYVPRGSNQGTGAATQTLQMEVQRNANDSRFLLLGVGCDGKLILDPWAETPFPLLDMTMKAASCSWLADQALAQFSEDEDDPVGLPGAMEFVTSTYSGSTRQTAITERAFSSVEYDFANGLVAAKDGNSLANAIGRWVTTQGQKALSVTMEWDDGLYDLAEAGTELQYLCGWGSTIGEGVGAIYIPRAGILGIEGADDGGVRMLRLTVGPMDIVDASTTNPVELSPVKIGIIDT